MPFLVENTSNMNSKEQMIYLKYLARTLKPKPPASLKIDLKLSVWEFWPQQTYKS